VAVLINICYIQKKFGTDMSSLFRAAAAAAESLLNAADESAAAALTTPQKVQLQHNQQRDGRPSSSHDHACTPIAPSVGNHAAADAGSPRAAAVSPPSAPTPLKFRVEPSKSSLRHVPADDDIDFEAMLTAEAASPSVSAQAQQHTPKPSLPPPPPSTLPRSFPGLDSGVASSSLLEQLSGGRDIVELLGENELLQSELASLRSSSDASSKKLNAKLSALQLQLDEQQARHDAILSRNTAEALSTESRLNARVHDLEAAHAHAGRIAAAAQGAAAAAELQVATQKDVIVRLQASLDEVTRQLDGARDAARTAAADADARASAERERFVETIAGLREAEAAAARDRELLSAAASDFNKKLEAAVAAAAEFKERACQADAAAAAAAAEATAAQLEIEALRQTISQDAAAAAVTAAAMRDERSKHEARVMDLQQQVAAASITAVVFSMPAIAHSVALPQLSQAHAAVLAATAQVPSLLTPAFMFCFFFFRSSSIT
jgi:hypothetical protein